MGRAMFLLEGPGKNSPYAFQLLGTALVQAGFSLILLPPLLLQGLCGHKGLQGCSLKMS